MRWKLIILICAASVMTFQMFSFDVAGDKNDKNITVEIRGEVQREGVYEMKRGSSLSQLLELCGINEKADISGISLQHVLYHKELIIIPEKKEKKLISINSADIEDLAMLPGIGEKTAERIIEYRREFGSFLNLEDIMNVKGIGRAKYEKIKGYIAL